MFQFCSFLGTLYITPTTICVSYTVSLLSMRQHKEIFPISALHDVYLPAAWLSNHNSRPAGGKADTSNNSGAVSVLYGNTLQLLFFKNTANTGSGGAGANGVNGRELLVSPMMMDCAKLRNVILEVRSAFSL